jgi:hypothetical protein
MKNESMKNRELDPNGNPIWWVKVVDVVAQLRDDMRRFVMELRRDYRKAISDKMRIRISDVPDFKEITTRDWWLEYDVGLQIWGRNMESFVHDVMPFICVLPWFERRRYASWIPAIFARITQVDIWRCGDADVGPGFIPSNEFNSPPEGSAYYIEDAMYDVSGPFHALSYYLNETVSESRYVLKPFAPKFEWYEHPESLVDWARLLDCSGAFIADTYGLESENSYAWAFDADMADPHIPADCSHDAVYAAYILVVDMAEDEETVTKAIRGVAGIAPYYSLWHMQCVYSYGKEKVRALRLMKRLDELPLNQNK